MARILGIDYGEKRTGIAVTDVLQLVASGLTTVPTENLIPFLKTYVSEEPVALIVIGEPKRHNGMPSDIEKAIQQCITELHKIIPEIPVKRVDERFSSKIAFRAMIDGGLKKKQRRNKALLDEISATVILQSYLSTTNR